MSRTLTTLQQAAWTNRNDPEAAHALGLALIARSDYHDALEYLHRAVDLAGGHAPYHRDLAAAYLALDRPRDAETWYARAVAIAPDDVGSVSGLAATHLEWLDAPDAAIPLYLRAIQLRPDQLQPYLAFARSQVRKDPADALARGQRALGQATPSRRLLQGFAAAFVQCGHLDAAQRCGERLRAEDEHDTVALTVCGSVAAMRRDDEASHAHHARAFACAPDDPAVLTAFLADLCARGQYREASRIYRRYRLALRGLYPTVDRQTREWDDEPLEGRRVLLQAIDHGHGDAIQFVRFAHLLRARGAITQVRCASPVRPLLETMPAVDLAAAPYDAMPPADVETPLYPLWLACGVDLDGVTPPEPYFNVPPQMRDAWRQRIPRRAGLNVGLVWRGSSRVEYSPYTSRQVPLALLDTLTDLAGLSCYSLQQGRGAEELTMRRSAVPIVDLGHDGHTFLDTAAAILALDLVVTIDTAVAHLAGSLGRPVCVLLPYVACWRWLRDTSWSPWYPSMRLFRQPAPGDWPRAIHDLRLHLEQRVAALPRTRSRDGQAPEHGSARD